jgi:hypothetical protein
MARHALVNPLLSLAQPQRELIRMRAGFPNRPLALAPGRNDEAEQNNDNRDHADEPE